MIDIIIFSGQSNMQGQTESRPLTRPVPNAYEYLLRANECVPLNHPIGESFGDSGENLALLSCAHAKNGSLVPACCRAFVKNRDRVVAIHVAQGATTISEWQPETERFKLAMTKIKKGIDEVKRMGEIGHIYLVWLQGESDAIYRVDRQTYLQKLITLKNAIKAEIPLEKFGIIRVGYFVSVCTWLEDDTMDVRIARDEAIMAAQEDAARTDSDFVMLTDITKDLSRDKTWINPHAQGHFNNKAMEKIGTAAGRTLAKLAK